MSTKMKLIPKKISKYINIVEIQDKNGYSRASVSIDMFWPEALGDEIYNYLNNGTSLVVELEIVEVL